MYEPPDAGMAEPSSANTSPSAIASSAPTPHAISDCGPPRVARIAGTVMKGPVPTMFDMLMETAFRSPRRRGNRPCSFLDCAAAMSMSTFNRDPSNPKPFVNSVRHPPPDYQQGSAAESQPGRELPLAGSADWPRRSPPAGSP